MKKRNIVIKPSQSFIDLASRPTQYGSSYPKDKPFIKMNRTSSNFSRYHVGKPVTFKPVDEKFIKAVMNYNITVKNVSVENPLKFHKADVLILDKDDKITKVSSEQKSCFTTLSEKAFRIFIAERVQNIELSVSFEKKKLVQEYLPIKLLPQFYFQYFNRHRDGLIELTLEMEEAYILEEPLIK